VRLCLLISMARVGVTEHRTPNGHGLRITMTDTECAAAAADGYSKEYVDSLKAQLQAKAEAMAHMTVRLEKVDGLQRATITKLQPEISEFVASLAASNPEQADELAPMIEWSNSCHKSEKLEQTMPLARLVSCASAQFKRSREEASQNEAKKEHVAAMAKKQDELVTSLDAKVARIGELEALCNERQAAAEKLQAELARIGGLKQAFDFNNASSREASAPAALTSCAAEAKLGIAPNMVASTSVASAAAVEDELLSFVNASSSGYAGNRICQSATGHAYLGVSGSSDGDVAAAIRMGSI